MDAFGTVPFLVALKILENSRHILEADCMDFCLVRGIHNSKQQILNCGRGHLDHVKLFRRHVNL